MLLILKLKSVLTEIFIWEITFPQKNDPLPERIRTGGYFESKH